MSAEHGFHRVRDEFAGRQRILHAGMPHGDAVVHADGVELKRHTTRGANRRTHLAADYIQMGVAGDDLHEGICHRDEWPFPVLFRLKHSGRA